MTVRGDQSSINGSSANVTLPFDRSAILTWTVITLTICVAGCFANIVLLYLSWPRINDKSGVNVLIFHFVLVNLLFCLFHVPIRCIMVQAKQAGHTLTDAKACYYLQSFYSVSWLVLYWADASLAVNRCIALVFPHHYKSCSTPLTNFVQISLMWGVNTAMVCVSVFSEGGVALILPVGHCAFRSNRTTYSNFLNLARFAPFLISGIASVLILIKTLTMSRSTNGVLQGGSVSQRGHGAGQVRLIQRVQLAKILVVIFVLSASCNIAFGVILSLFPRVFEQNPMWNLWMQTFVAIPYLLTACILLSSIKYKNRLYLLSRSITPLGHSATRFRSRTRTNPDSMTSTEMSVISRTKSTNGSPLQRRSSRDL